MALTSLLLPAKPAWLVGTRARSELHLSPTFFWQLLCSRDSPLRLLVWAVIQHNRAHIPFSSCLSAVAVQPSAFAVTWLLGFSLFPFQGVNSSAKGKVLFRLLTKFPFTMRNASNMNRTAELLQLLSSLAKARNSGNRVRPEASFNFGLAATASTMAEV